MVPIRMLGGSPISVAVPPILEANTSANRNGNAETSSSSVMAKVTGTIKSTVLTLLSSSGEERGRDLQRQQDARRARLDPLRRPDGEILEQAGAP